MKKTLLPAFMAIIALINLTSCGGGGGGSGSVTPSTSPEIQEQQSEGSYRAILRPMNNTLSGFIPTGSAEVQIENDSVQIKTFLDDDARVSHLQNIHVGSRCPTIDDDKNGDGLIDIEESYQIVGKVLIPLDGDINSAEASAGIYPLGGGFTYVESASLSKLESDVKARTEENLNLGGRVVLLHGVDGGTKMPETVVSRDNMLKQASIPIVCGILERKNI